MDSAHEIPSQTPSAIVPTYARANVAFERGEGCWLTSTTGERYLDFGAGIAVNSVGHAHPHLVETLVNQGSKLWHVSNLYQNPEGERYARRLVDATFADLVFFTNSGAEANEAAIKMARRRQSIDGHPEKYRTLTFEGAFHGRTLATIAAGGQQKYLDGFGPKVDGFDQIPITDLAAVEAAIGPETGSILIEPIQGEGGVRVIPPAFLRGLREICDRHGLLLIFDEVQTGVGRTGRFYAYEHCGIHPDILTSAKGIGAGFPMSACLATADAARGLTTRRARDDLRRQPAGDGDRQRHARRHPRARVSRECRKARPRPPPEAGGAQGSPRIRDRGGARRGPDGRLEAQGSAGRLRRGSDEGEAARHSGGRQCRAHSAAARRYARRARGRRAAARRGLQPRSSSASRSQSTDERAASNGSASFPRSSRCADRRTAADPRLGARPQERTASRARRRQGSRSPARRWR